jgi:hypothetical protein
LKATLNLFGRIAPGMFAVLLMAACGTPGAPVPPSLELPVPPQDLAASRKGNKVTLTWTPPSQTTDGQNLRAKFAGPAVVCRAVDEPLMANCVEKVGELAASVPPLGQRHGPRPAPLAPGTPKNEFTATLPESLQRQNPLGFATFAVEAENWRGRSAGLSNQVKVPLAPAAGEPTQFQAKVTSDGVALSWCVRYPYDAARAIQFRDRVYRQEKGGAPAAIGEGPPNASESACGQGGTLTDHSFEWEKTYDYWVTAVSVVTKNGATATEVEGDDSPHLTVFAHDVFPPAVPVGVQAVASGVGQKPFIDLTWAPDTEADLAGYNVYRQEQGAENWVKINTALAPTPSFRDENVAPGNTYNYAVSAVDVRGNESARSEATSEMLPESSR